MRNRHLLVLLGGELLLLVLLATLGDLRRHVPLFLLLFALLALVYYAAITTARRTRLSLPAILISSIVLRIPMFFTQPSLSDDVWRYLHDGRAQHAGINPYAYAPADPRTAGFRGPEYERINHPDLPTIYPPVAQYAFRLAASFADPLLAWRLILLAAEFVIIIAAALLLRQRDQPPVNVIFYAWHPLVVIEAIGSAHLEPLAIALLLLALVFLAHRKTMSGAAALAASVAAKLVAAPLLLFLPIKRALPAFAAVLLMLYAPMSLGAVNPLGSLGVFARNWASNGSIAPLLTLLIGNTAYRLFAATALLLMLIALKRKALDVRDVALIWFLMLFALAPVVHAWYLLWPLALLPLRNNPLDTLGKCALAWSMTVALSYVAHTYQLETGVWRIPPALLIAEYAPVAGLAAYGVVANTSGAFSAMKLMPSKRKTAAKM